MSTNTVGHRVTPSLQTGLTALGSTQSTALLLTNNSWHEFTTVASGTGAILPTGMAPSEIRVFNNGASSLRIYPPLGGTINSGTPNVPVSLAAGNGLTYWASSPSNWYSIQSVSSGSSSLPGGTSGQIQYDNAGTFSGFTASGDATINTSTGAVTVTKTNGTAFAPSATLDATNAGNIGTGTLPAGRLPALTGAITTAAGSSTTSFGSIPTLNVLANTTGGVAAPAGVSLSALFDAAIDNAQGDLIYRGASAWTKLVPGTIGALLYTGGPGAIPGWTNQVFTKTDGNLNFTPLSHTTVAAGDLWYASSDQGTFSIGRASGQARLGGCIFSCGACTAVANTSGSYVSLFGSPTGAKGSLTIPANSLVAGNLLRWMATFSWGCTASTPSIQFQVLLGATVVLGAFTSAALGGGSAFSGKPGSFNQQSYLSILTGGSSGTVCGVCLPALLDIGARTATSAPGGSTPVASVTVDLTTSRLFDIQAQWTASSPSNTINITSFQLFLEN
jgi:hypothetical protein